jgi:hypothetical protein
MQVRAQKSFFIWKNAGKAELREIQVCAYVSYIYIYFIL